MARPGAQAPFVRKKGGAQASFDRKKSPARSRAEKSMVMGVLKNCKGEDEGIFAPNMVNAA
jgi:hypothetical protein